MEISVASTVTAVISQIAVLPLDVVTSTFAEPAASAFIVAVLPLGVKVKFVGLPKPETNPHVYVVLALDGERDAVKVVVCPTLIVTLD